MDELKHWTTDSSRFLEGLSSVQSLSRIRLFATPWTAARLPVHHQLPELAQTRVHGVGDATQPSHPKRPYSCQKLSSPTHLPQHVFHSLTTIRLGKKEQASGWGNGAGWQGCLWGKVHGFSACFTRACMKANKENPEGSSLYKRKGYLEKRSTRVSPDVPEEITFLLYHSGAVWHRTEPSEVQSKTALEVTKPAHPSWTPGQLSLALGKTDGSRTSRNCSDRNSHQPPGKLNTDLTRGLSKEKGFSGSEAV